MTKFASWLSAVLQNFPQRQSLKISPRSRTDTKMCNTRQCVTSTTVGLSTILADFSPATTSPTTHAGHPSILDISSQKTSAFSFGKQISKPPANVTNYNARNVATDVSSPDVSGVVPLRKFAFPTATATAFTFAMTGIV